MKLLLAITGASGAIYPKLFLENIKKQSGVDCFVVASENAQRIFKEECGLPLGDIWPHVYDRRNFDVPYVSGSSKMDAMIVLPCSMGTLGRMASGISDDAITRAADVFLKERRKLILVPRDTPFNAIHLENMLRLDRAGALILPATPSFYSHPKTVDEVAATVVSRILDHLGLSNTLMKRWTE
jgi:4-hydroxy-3-polyprenylbenzoate decarboxylase